MSVIRKQIRVEQTLSEIERLQNEFDRWKARRDEADKEKEQYQTQLKALKEVVAKALADIREDTGKILDDKPGVGTVYERCRLQEKRTLWVRRVLWGYFREKFDQRDQSDGLRKLLGAADDVVWSCYYEAHQQVARNQPLNPIPLAYVEPFYSPRALPRDEPPGILKEKRLGDSFLADFFTRLPIPLVSMPPNCLAEPWWLVYLGHEVGHHVQHDLGLVDPFAEQLFDVATEDPEPVEDESAAQRWYDWGQEIFADVFSIYMMGTNAVWAMAELETHPDRDMIIRKQNYPSPTVRLMLLAKVADKLGLDGTAALRGEDANQRLARPPADDFEAELQQEMVADVAMLNKMVEALTKQKLGKLGTFRKLSGWNGFDFSSKGEMSKWQSALAKGKMHLSRQKGLSLARIIVSAGVGAWREITTSDQVTDRPQALETLNRLLLDAIEEHRDKTTRAADAKALQDVGDVAADISEQLRHAEFFEW